MINPTSEKLLRLHLELANKLKPELWDIFDQLTQQPSNRIYKLFIRGQRNYIFEKLCPHALALLDNTVKNIFEELLD